MTKHNEVQNVPSDQEIAAIYERTQTYPLSDEDWHGAILFARAILTKYAATLGPLTVSLSPDPRGVHVAVHQGSECVHAEAMALPEAVGQSVQDRWTPEVCPITNRPFFMWIEHHKTGEYVPTFGGPYDSYTLPTWDGTEFVCERYDHDRGGWLVDEIQGLGLRVVDDQSVVIEPDHPRYGDMDDLLASPTPPAGEGQEPVVITGGSHLIAVDRAVGSIANGTKLYTHPAPQAAQTPMDEAIAAGSGTLHDAIEYWMERALKAEAGTLINEGTRVQPAQDEREATLDIQAENKAFNAWRFKDAKFIEDPSLGRLAIPKHDAWDAWQARAALSTPPVLSFQDRVQPWMMECFGPEIAADCIERNHRFFEEATELVQSLGMTASEAHQLVDYVFGRPVGEPKQETGGVMVTLAALCLANGLDMHHAGETELARIWTKVDVIRAKQAAKPKHSPLPEASTPPMEGELTLRQAYDDACLTANHNSLDAGRWRAFRARDEFGQVNCSAFTHRFREDADRIIDAAITSALKAREPS